MKSLLRQELDELQKQLDDPRVYQREDYPPDSQNAIKN